MDSAISPPRFTSDPRELLTQARRIAVVGFSTDPEKPAHFAPMRLAARGWEVIPIHPTATEIAGLKAYPSLSAVPGSIDLVNVFRRSENVPPVAVEAAQLGVKTLWLQVGIQSDEAMKTATDAGMDYVDNLCAGALAEKYDLHPSR